jgi:hypothetical protein
MTALAVGASALESRSLRSMAGSPLHQAAAVTLAHASDSTQGM